MCNFSHLHTHTEYSLFDGTAKVEHIFGKAKRSGVAAVAVTDHHNVFAWFQASEAGKKHGVKAIYGIELNVDKHHLTALAINEEGLRNLILLNNLGYLRGGSKPKICEKELFAHHEGIFFLSGCSNGKIPSLVLENRVVEAIEAAEIYASAFPGRFALEVQNYKDPKHAALIKALLHVGREKKLGLIPTNDCHYLEKEDREFHRKMVSMHAQGKISPCNGENYYKTVEEMLRFFSQKALEQTKKISEMIEADFESFIQKQNGAHELPVGMLYYYDDAEALKRALYARKEYALGEFMHKKMKKEDKTLEDLYQKGTLEEDIKFAYGLRGKLYKIEPDPYYYIKTSEHFPVYRKSKEKSAAFCAQLDHFAAQRLGFEIADRRKSKLFAF